MYMYKKKQIYKFSISWISLEANLPLTQRIFHLMVFICFLFILLVSWTTLKVAWSKFISFIMIPSTLFLLWQTKIEIQMFRIHHFNFLKRKFSFFFFWSISKYEKADRFLSSQFKKKNNKKHHGIIYFFMERHSKT